MCMCVCACGYVHVHVHVYVYVYVYMYVYVYVYVYVSDCIESKSKVNRIVFDLPSIYLQFTCDLHRNMHIHIILK